MKIIFGLILFFSLCGLGNAQSQSTGDKFSDKLNEQYEAADKIEENVLQMLQGSISDRDYKWGIMAHDSARKFGVYADFLLTLSFIHTDIQNDQDKMIVKKFFTTKCRNTVKFGEVQIEHINTDLSSIKSIALVNEITKMRDAIDGMMKTLEICKK